MNAYDYSRVFWTWIHDAAPLHPTVADGVRDEWQAYLERVYRALELAEGGAR